jgi:hypothetical protein
MTKRDVREQGRIILAHGEATGHCHEVVAVDTGLPPSMEAAQFFEVDGLRTLIVLAPCELRHQEHAPIALDPASPIMWRQGDVLGIPTAPGTWRIERQREQYSPNEWRQVAD